MIRNWRVAFNPDTGRPSYLNRSFSCGIVRVFMKAVNVVTSDDRLVVDMVATLSDKRNAKAIKVDLVQGSSKDKGLIQPGQL